MVNIKIEGVSYQVEEGLTILEAAKKCGYEIPSLCAFNHGECSQGSCRVCLVEVKGARGLVASCVYPVNEGMEIIISSPKAVEARRASVELLLSNHNWGCQQCDKNGKCELLRVAAVTGAREGRYIGSKTPVTVDQLTPAIIRDTSKCILCGRCVARCASAHGMGILGFENRGFNTIVAPAENRSFVNSPCIQCGQCVSVCPTGALMEKSEIAKVDEAFKSGKHVVVQTAPAVRAALGEEFGMSVGTPVTGKMVAAMKRLGFHKVYDTNFAADLTIMEEGTELLGRIRSGGKLPMITSCSPGWINYAEYNYGDLLEHLSSCKSPHQMQGAILKSYYAEKKGIDPKDIFVVSIMPCTAKKDESQREQLNVGGLRDVDAVLTTRELAKMIKRAGILFTRLPDEEFDQDLMGEYTGAGVIFGVTGGVMEAALRTVYFVLTGKEHEAIKFEAVRGFEGVREASIDINGQTIHVAIAHGMKNAKADLPEDAVIDLIVALITLKYTQSNSVCFAFDGQSIGVGAGQQSRIHCTRLAGSKADTWFLRQHPKTLNLKFRADLGRANRDNVIDGYINGNEEDVCAEGIWQNYFTEQPERLTEGDRRAWLASRHDVAMGSDAFLPFSDNIKRAFASGVKYIAQPGGSIRDDLVIEECNKKDMVMAFTGMRLFHH